MGRTPPLGDHAHGHIGVSEVENPKMTFFEVPNPPFNTVNYGSKFQIVDVIRLGPFVGKNFRPVPPVCTRTLPRVVLGI